MKTCRLALALGGVLAASGWAAAQAPAFDWGVQTGLQAPLQGDLRFTTGSGLNPELGLHADWNASPDWSLRTRLDLAWFSSGDQQSTALPIQQAIHTRVRNGALGEEWLYRPARLGGAWEFGAGLYLVRWTVASTDRLQTADGSFVASGSSTWTRAGQGALAGYRWNRHLETELRFLFSHYGYENQPTRVASMNVLWHF